MTPPDDFDGDGRSEVAITSPLGFAILKQTGPLLVPAVSVLNGTGIRDWPLDTIGNGFHLAADLDGNGCCELFVSSDWGVGVLAQRGTMMDAVATAVNGTRVGGWLLDTATNRFGPSGDFDGDGIPEMLVASPWGIAIFKLSGPAFSVVTTVPNGMLLGGWMLNTVENRFGPVGDVDGDGRSEILVSGASGVAVLKLSGASLTAPVFVPNGTRCGAWVLDTADNRFHAFADFGGDGLEQLLAVSPSGLGLLKFTGGGCAADVVVQNGTALGGWLLNTFDNRVGPAADYDGDGRDELLLTSPWGAGIIKISGGGATSPVMCANGTLLGDWVLNTAENGFHGAGDYDGDGRAEIVMTSDWSIGVLDVDAGTMHIGALLRWRDEKLAKLIPAVVKRQETFALDVEVNPPGVGRVDGAGVYESGKQVSLRASANYGWVFRRWTEEGREASSVADTLAVTVNQHRTYVAHFERTDAPLNASRAAALEIAIDYIGQFNTSNAPLSDGEPPIADCGGLGNPEIGRAIWFRFTPAFTGSYGAIANSTAFYAVVAMYHGSELLGCGWGISDGDMPTKPPGLSGGWFDLQAGSTYHVRVGGNYGEGGPVEFNLKRHPWLPYR